MFPSRQFQTPPPRLQLSPDGSLPPEGAPSRATPTMPPAPTDLASLKRGIAAIETSLDAIKKSSQNPPPTLRPNPIPALIKDRPFDPYGPADSDTAILMWKVFELEGYAGLTYAAIKAVEEYKKDPDITPIKNYEVISELNRDKIMNIFLTMHYDFLKHLLRGDLMWQYFHDTKFHMAVNLHHALKKVPGTYVQALVRREFELVPPNTQTTAVTLEDRRQTNPDAGGWLTGREIHRLYHVALTYLPGRSNTDIDEARRIDQVHQGFPEQARIFYVQGGRRYITPANRGKFEKWLQVWKEVYVDRINPLIVAERQTGITNNDLDVPLRRCLFEIGYGVDVRQRANAHDLHSASNSLWTFFLALVNYLFDPNQDIFLVYRFQTNYIAPPKINDAYDLAVISDVLQTLVARSEWHQGGFNPVPGGGGGVNKARLEQNAQWLEDSFDHIYSEQSVFLGNLERLKQQSDWMRGFHDRVKEQPHRLRRLDEQRKRTLEDVEELKKRLELLKRVALRLKLKEMVEAYQKARSPPTQSDEPEEQGPEGPEMYD